MYPIHLAFEKINDENVLGRVVQTLLHSGADIEVEDKNGVTPLMYASYRGHKEIVQTFLQTGADIEAQDKYGRTPLIHAGLNNRKEVVQTLIRAGANIEARNKNGWTPLIYACIYDREEIFNFLIDSGADINTQDKHGITPLMYLAEIDDEENGKMLQKLLERTDLDVFLKDNDGKTVIDFALEGENYKFALEIIMKFDIERCVPVQCLLEKLQKHRVNVRSLEARLDEENSLLSLLLDEESNIHYIKRIFEILIPNINSIEELRYISNCLLGFI